MNIVVLAGGLSPERDVSLSTGTLVTNALRDKGHNAILVDLFFGVNTLPDPIESAFSISGRLAPRAIPETAPDIGQIRKSRDGGFSESIGFGVMELCRAADIVFLALHGGDGENGRLQAFFDLCGIRYTGSSSFGCALAMNKAVAKSLLRTAEVPTADWVSLVSGQSVAAEAITLPCVVKPNCGGSSIGVSIVRDPARLSNAIDEALELERELIIETFVEGMELSVGVIGDPHDLSNPAYALPPIEIVPKRSFYDYAHKYQSGWTDEYVPARISGERTRGLQDYAVAAYRALDLNVYARIDFLLTRDGDAYCLEANTLPGMTPTSLLPQEAAAYGMDYPSLCDEIVRLSMRKY